MSGSVGASSTTGRTPPAAETTTAAPSSSMDANATSADEELEETVSRLFSHPGVQAVIILNRTGDVLVERSTAALRRTTSGAADDTDAGVVAGADVHAASIQQQQQHVLPKRLNQMLQSVRGLLRALPDPQHGNGATGAGGGGDDIGFLQIRSADGAREIMVAPHQGYVLAVMKMAADS